MNLVPTQEAGQPECPTRGPLNLYLRADSQSALSALPPTRQVSSPGGRTIHASRPQRLQLATRICSPMRRQSPRLCPRS
jgi:hypothetical protein